MSKDSGLRRVTKMKRLRSKGVDEPPGLLAMSCSLSNALVLLTVLVRRRVALDTGDRIPHPVATPR